MKNSILQSVRKTTWCILLVFASLSTFSQCPAGYSKYTLKWDYLDYIIYNAYYTFSNGYYTSLPYVQNQYFSFGSQRLNIACNYSKNNIFGENTTHRGETGSYGDEKPGITGNNIDADVQFLGNGQIVLTFDTEVYNLQFSMFDVDNKQMVDLSAVNAAATALPITVTTLGATQLIVNNNNTTAVNVVSPLVGGLPQYAGTTSVNASFNVDIAGPVKQVTLNVSNSGNDGNDNGSFWLSDITACTPGAFPTNYYAVSKPFTGQPSYVLHSLGNTVYKLDPATGKTKSLFKDTAATTINSMAYDPYNKFLYYVNDDGLFNSAGRSLKRYDFNKDSVSFVSTDLVALGIALSTFEGVNNGGAAFYNGSLYLGIQTASASYASGRETIIWRIDFDASNNPYRVSQAFALPCDDGAGLVNGFGDFVIRDGMLYEGDNAADEPDYYQFDMTTGLGTVYPINPFPDDQPGELALDWTGKIYQLLSDNIDGITPYVAVYNEDGTIGSKTPIVSNPMYTPATPLLGDAAEAFRPKSDFGDAPASYDPAGVDPATHEKDDNLRLGNNYGYEWSKTPIVDGDTYEDGLGAAPTLNYFGTTTYAINVNVFNNTGANATLVCWLDWNFNGVYDPGEGQPVTVPPSPSMQLVPVTWNMWVPNTSNTNTWLRLRLTSAVNGMTVNNMNGYYPDGEVEDYPVYMGAMLATNILSFSADLDKKKAVDLQWELSASDDLSGCEVQRSADNAHWETLATLKAYDNGAAHVYSTTDNAPLAGLSFYRVRLLLKDNAMQYSSIEPITIKDGANALHVSINPADQYTVLKISSSTGGDGMVNINDNSGRLMLQKHIAVKEGENLVQVNNLDKLSPGIYYVTVKTATMQAVEKLVITR